MMKLAAIALTLLAASLVFGQQQPYTGQQQRELKALSPEEVQQYLSGAGMGYAKPAELNRYPGPMHVLELADQLWLTPEQQVKTRTLMDAHKAEARAIGAMRVEAERALDALFASGKVDEGTLTRAVRAAAALEGDYRLSHLETHRRMRALLTEEQIARYDYLRGYAAGGGHRHGVQLAQAGQHAGDLADGEIRKVDKDAGKITIKHGPIRNLDMPGMTMVFQVKERRLLDQVKAGDKVRFSAEKVGGQYTVTRIEAAN
jgi:Cu/Ag efflux protein CusF